MDEDIERDGPSEEKEMNMVALSISCLIFKLKQMSKRTAWRFPGLLPNKTGPRLLSY